MASISIRVLLIALATIVSVVRHSAAHSLATDPKQDLTTMEGCVQLLSSKVALVETPRAVVEFLEMVEGVLPNVPFESYHSADDDMALALRMDYPGDECTEFMDAIDLAEDNFREEGPKCNDVFEADEPKFMDLLKKDPVLARVTPQREACFAFVP